MLTLNLPKQTEAALAALAARCGMAESDYLVELVSEHLSEMQALEVADARLSANRPPISLTEVKTQLGLDD